MEGDWKNSSVVAVAAVEEEYAAAVDIAVEAAQRIHVVHTDSQTIAPALKQQQQPVDSQPHPQEAVSSLYV